MYYWQSRLQCWLTITINPLADNPPPLWSCDCHLDEDGDDGDDGEDGDGDDDDNDDEDDDEGKWLIQGSGQAGPLRSTKTD